MFGDDPLLAQDSPPDLIGDVATVVVVHPAEASISVTHRYVFTNTAADQTFSGFFETLPFNARNVKASWSGGTLPAVNIPDGAGFAEWLVTFDEPLAPGGQIESSLSWDGVDMLGSLDSFDRVSPDLVAIAPYAVGHRGEVTLDVIVSDSWEVAFAEGYVVEYADDHVVLSGELSADDAYVARPLVLEAPNRFTESTLDVGPISITVATAEGSSDWIDSDLSSLVDALSEWIPLAPPTDLVLRQGYTGGEDLRRDGEVFVLPLDLSVVVATRAIATAWLDALDFRDPGLRDDLATALADRVARAKGLVAAPSLGQWSTATAALVSVSDEMTMRTILTALESGVPAYPGVADPFSEAAIDWRRFTDVAEHIGAVASAGDAMRLSATPEQLVELDVRASALVDYRALETRAAPWSLPPLLRDAMSAWAFAEFRAAQVSVSDLVLARDEMAAAAASVDLESGDQVRDEFERATSSMDETWSLLVGQREALVSVSEALRLDTGDRGLLSTVGMAGRDAASQRAQMHAAWTAGSFSEAAERGDRLVEDYEGSVGRGTLRLFGPVGAIVLVAVLIQRVRAGGRSDAQPSTV